MRTRTRIQTKTGALDPLCTVLRGHEELRILALLGARLKDFILPEKWSEDSRKS